MRTQLPFSLLAVLAFACSLYASPAQAQRAFVSATGSDSNPCTFASPCRSFQHAHDVTSANGEIDVIDPAGYGPLTISKSISIQGHGFSGVSVPSSGVGITINASSTDAVHLNGLLIEGGQAGQTGIAFNSGQSLTIENCVVRNVTSDGFDFFPTGNATLAVSNSYFSDNGLEGIFIRAQSSGIAASIDRTMFSGNAGDGLVLDGSAGTGFHSAAVTDSVAANNGNAGFVVSSIAGHATINLSLTRSLAEGSGTGVVAGGSNATLALTQSTVMGNAVGFLAAGGGVIKTFHSNYLAAANGPPTGSLTPTGTQ